MWVEDIGLSPISAVGISGWVPTETNNNQSARAGVDWRPNQIRSGLATRDQAIDGHMKRH